MIGVIRADVHQLCNGCTALIHRTVLEPLADLIKEHNGYRFRGFAHEHGAQGSNGHEKVFVKNLPTQNVFCGPQQYFAARNHIGRNQCSPPPQAFRQQQACHKQHRSYANKRQGVVFLPFLVIMSMSMAMLGSCILLYFAHPAFRFHTLASRHNVLRYLIEMILRSGEAHGFCKEVDPQFLHARNLRCRFLHLCCTSSAIQLIQGISLLHGVSLHLRFSIQDKISFEQVFICYYIAFCLLVNRKKQIPAIFLWQRYILSVCALGHGRNTGCLSSGAIGRIISRIPSF